jgi:hypothetical protein
VATYVDSSGLDHGLLLDETNGTWTAGTRAALPANAGFNATPDVPLSSVSCPSPGNRTAVGDYHDGSEDPQGLLLTEARHRITIRR